jgi:hypothetical protein
MNNLPPGVTVSMIPGCTKEDELWEDYIDRLWAAHPEWSEDRVYEYAEAHFRRYNHMEDYDGPDNWRDDYEPE